MWWTKGWIVRGVALVAFSIGGLQLAPGPAHVNPAVVPSHTLQAATAVPPHVHALLRRSCMDCHSNETRWPWYSHIAPLSWGVASDIAQARKALNFSEWDKSAGKRPGTAIGLLAAMCAGVKQDRMPLAKYRLLHPEARLSAADKDSLCEWTSAEMTRYMEKRRRMLVTQIGR